MKTGFEICALTKTFPDGTVALDKVSFKIEPQKHLAILGSSGCGKTSLLKMLTGLDAPTSGEISLNNRVISQGEFILMPPFKRGISMVFQDLALWPNLTVLENVLIGIGSKNETKQESNRRAHEVLNLCQIDHLIHRKPATISGGQQQRVALARALVSNPHYLFLDEPFSSLDLVIKSTLLKEILLLANKKDITIVLVSHDPMEAMLLCKSVIVLNQGKIEEIGTFTEVLKEPKSGILKMFKSQVQGVTHEEQN